MQRGIPTHWQLLAAGHWPRCLSLGCLGCCDLHDLLVPTSLASAPPSTLRNRYCLGMFRYGTTSKVRMRHVHYHGRGLSSGFVSLVLGCAWQDLASRCCLLLRTWDLEVLAAFPKRRSSRLLHSIHQPNQDTHGYSVSVRTCDHSFNSEKRL